jgi:hypothetical protein
VSAIRVEAPARIRETHVRDRFVDRGDREPRGYRNVTWAVQVAYDHGRLSGGKGDANVRWAVICEYADLYEEALHRSGRDSTDMDVVSGGAGSPVSDAMLEASKKLVSIDSHMASKDRKIVRALCEGLTLAKAVEQACGEDFTHTVPARVRDAIDALTEAMTEARESGYRYVRMVGT